MRTDLQQANWSMPAEQLSYYWQQYRSAAKEGLAGYFSDYVKHGNDIAKAAGEPVRQMVCLCG